MKIHNWDRWQSYRKDRGQPPWIKIHREVMRHVEWVELTDAQRGQLVGIWLLGADHDGVIPASPKIIQKLCYMDSEPDLQLFVDKGFLEPDANVTPQRRQRDQPETETETETETEKEVVAKSRRFAPPALNEISEYMVESGLGNQTDVENFHDHFTSNGWKVGGRTKMKDWKAAYRKWARSSSTFAGPKRSSLEGTSYAQ